MWALAGRGSWIDEDVDAIAAAWRDGAEGLVSDEQRAFLNDWLHARAARLR